MDQWTNSCRSCLKRAEPFSHFIYQHISPKQYFYCTSIEVKRDDELPKAICEKCFTLINKFIEFKMKCTQSENKLLRFSRGLLYKDEPYSELEEKYANLDLHVTCQNRNNELHAKEMYSDLKTKIEDTKEDEVEAKLRDSNDEVTDTQETDLLEDTKDHVNARNIRFVKPRKSTKKSMEVRNSLPKNYKCEHCNRKFSFKKRLDDHMLLHEGKTTSIESLECKKCYKTYSTKEDLQTHVKTCHTRHPFKDVTCQVCSKVCKTPGTLRIHKKTHEGRREQVCEECGKVFKSEVTFRNHLQTHTKNRERNFTCVHCGKKYISKKTCAKHVSRRHTTRQFICDYCQYVFTDKANLTRHIMLHEGTHPKYKCDICSRSLTSKASLLVHKRIHTGEKPYSCNHCSKSFSDRAWLVEHERNHTGEKPFQCSVCALRFSRRGSMRRHMKVHNMWEKSRGPKGNICKTVNDMRD